MGPYPEPQRPPDHTTDTNVATCPNCGQRNRVPACGPGIPRCAQCHQWLPWIAAAGDRDFADVVASSTVPVVVDFSASWCAPCRMVSPALVQLATERASALKLVKVDVDAAPAVARRFAVQSVPILLLVDRGQILARHSGAAPATVLRSWVDHALSG